jgi:Zn-dependent peptidase ImmA (M78 family)/transcriptional regulator with XRE-family HTH domain
LYNKEVHVADIGDRVRAAREAAGLSLRALAERVEGLDHTAISRIETGERRVKSHELFDLAEALGTTTASLLGSADRSSALALAARLSGEGRPDFLDSAVERVNQVLEMDDLLRRVAGGGAMPARPTVDLPGTGSALMQGRAASEATRDALGLGVGPVGDLPALLEERFGVHVVVQPVAGDVHGICVSDGDIGVVLINSNDRWGRQRFTAAHELCHLLFGDLELYEVTEKRPPTETSEKRAEAFAAHFLAPNVGVLQVINGRRVDDAVVAELMHYFGMSLDAMCWRLYNLRVLTKGRAEEMRATGVRTIASASSLADEFARRAGDSERVTRSPTRLTRRALAAYADGLVGVGVVAAVLGSPDLGAVRRWLEARNLSPERTSALSGAELV